MATNVQHSDKGTENLARLLKLFKVGNQICKRLLFDCIQQTGCHDLRQFLSKNETVLRRKLNRNREQIALLFPRAPQEPDMKDWDINLVAFLLRKCCRLPSSEEQAVQAFSNMRNKIAHLAEPSLDEQEFLTYKREFERTAHVLLNHINDPQFRNEISTSAKDVISRQIYVDGEAMMSYLRQILDQLLATAEPEGTPAIETLVAVQKCLLNIYEQLNEIQVLKIVSKTVNVNKVYVDSNIVSVKRRYGFSGGEGDDDCQRVTTYREFFGETPRNVYLLGSSGRGKTTFCHHMVDHWCQEIRSKHGGVCQHSEETYLSDTFDFIFFISLEKDGSIADMIKRQLFIENQHYYEFVMKFLLTNPHRVLLVLDDLDEWQMVNPGTLPCREHLNHCVTLMTLRHSEIGIIPLKGKDYLYEIKELCEDSVKKLVENIAVQVCGDREKARVHKCLEDLKKQHINEIPMVLTFFVFSWYNDETAGQSRVGIYARIIRFLLSTVKNESEQADCQKG